MGNPEVWTILGVMIPAQAIIFGYLSHQISTLTQQVVDVRVDLARIEQKIDDHVGDERAHVQ